MDMLSRQLRSNPHGTLSAMVFITPEAVVSSDVRPDLDEPELWPMSLLCRASGWVLVSSRDWTLGTLKSTLGRYRDGPGMDRCRSSALMMKLWFDWGAPVQPLPHVLTRLPP